jgi:hypothetical protein
MNKILRNYYIKITAVAFIWGLVIIILYNLGITILVRFDLVLWVNTLFFIIIISLSLGLRQDLIAEKQRSNLILIYTQLDIIKHKQNIIKSRLFTLCAQRKK